MTQKKANVVGVVPDPDDQSASRTRPTTETRTLRPLRLIFILNDSLQDIRTSWANVLELAVTADLR